MKSSAASDPLFDQIPWVVFDSWLAVVLLVLLLQVQLMQLMRASDATHGAAASSDAGATHAKFRPHR